MAKYSDLQAGIDDGLVHFWNFNESEGEVISDPIGSLNLNAEIRGPNPLTAAQINASSVSTDRGRGRSIVENWNTSTEYEGVVIYRGPVTNGTAETPEYSARAVLYIRPDRKEFVATNYSGWDSYLCIGAGSKAVRLDAFYDGLGGAELSAQIGSAYLTVGALVEGWYDVVVTSAGGVAKLFVQGALIDSATNTNGLNIAFAGPFAGSANASDFGSTEPHQFLDGIFDELSIWNRPLGAAEIAALWNGGTPQTLVQEASPSEGTISASVQVVGNVQGQVGGSFGSVNASVGVKASVMGYQDWTKRLGPLGLQEVYLLVITGEPAGLEDLTVPISSWQATSQAEGLASYLQAVIPAGNNLVGDISAREGGELVIRKGFLLSSGEMKTEEILRSSFDTFRYDRGPRRFTSIVSGYRRDQVSQAGSRAVTGVRYLNMSNGKLRVRCDIDLFLKPGMTVEADGETLLASYINYYVSDAGKFCEISER